jgi:hypothetical protein
MAIDIALFANTLTVQDQLHRRGAMSETLAIFVLFLLACLALAAHAQPPLVLSH